MATSQGGAGGGGGSSANLCGDDGLVARGPGLGGAGNEVTIVGSGGSGGAGTGGSGGAGTRGSGGAGTGGPGGSGSGGSGAPGVKMSCGSASADPLPYTAG